MIRKILLITAIASFPLLNACGNDSKSTKVETEGDKTTAKVDEKKVVGTIKITKAEFLTKIIDYTKGEANMKYLGDKPAMVDFYADWCGPCRTAAPILEELAKEYAGKIYIYKVDTQKEQELASELGIQGIPAFFYFPMEGKPFASSGIARSPEETKKMFKDIIDKQLLKVKI